MVAGLRIQDGNKLFHLWGALAFTVLTFVTTGMHALTPATTNTVENLRSDQ
jgi:hypothetical protein